MRHLVRNLIRRSQKRTPAKANLELFLQNVRPTDIFLVGHPKSGNTWLTYMLAVAFHKDFDQQITMANLGEFSPFHHGDDLFLVSTSGNDPRILRNHRPVYPEYYPRTLYTVRDPRAVLVSYYHHRRVTTGDSETSLDSFVEHYLTGTPLPGLDGSIQRWDKDVLNWMDRKNHKPVMIVKYEDMKADRKDVLLKVLDFAGVQLEPSVISLAVERSSFEAMREDESKHGAESYPGEMGNRGNFVRKGEKDSWRYEMSEQLQMLVADKFKDAMNAIGYS